MNCNNCEGTGKIDMCGTGDNMDVYEDICPDCKGTGTIDKVEAPKIIEKDNTKWKAKLLSILENNYDPEGLIDALAEIIEDEKNKQQHELVVFCLESVIDSLKQAAFDYYVSTK